MPETLRDRAAAARKFSAQARRLANDQTNSADKDRLAQYAAELEAKAAEMERRAGEP